MSFKKLGLSPAIVQTLNALGYNSPTPIQTQAIPAVLSGEDLIASAQTGTGKTASFALPLIQAYSGNHKRRAKRLRALILTPTRELAQQVHENVSRYSQGLNFKSMVVVGGVEMDAQKEALVNGVDLLVATPGRLLDLARQRALHFDELKLLVLDEADRMLDMGFIDEIRAIIERLPENRQTLLFSATLPSSVRRLAKDALFKPSEISTSNEKSAKPLITQWLVAVDKHNKSALLSYLIKEQKWQQALIFIRTQQGAAKLVSQLQKRGITAECIHGGRSQASRSKIMAGFKEGNIGILIATGIAARGIDIIELTRVVNYDLPDDADEYIHRIGRTGRAGSSGEAVSLVSKDDFKRLCAIERRQHGIIKRRTFADFKVVKDLPKSDLNFLRKQKKSK